MSPSVLRRIDHTESVCDVDDELFRKLSDLLKFSPF